MSDAGQQLACQGADRCSRGASSLDCSPVEVAVLCRMLEVDNGSRPQPDVSVCHSFWEKVTLMLCLFQEIQRLQEDTDKARKHSSVLERDNQRLEIQVKDLSQQVRRHCLFYIGCTGN